MIKLNYGLPKKVTFLVKNSAKSWISKKNLTQPKNSIFSLLCLSPPAASSNYCLTIFWPIFRPAPVTFDPPRHPSTTSHHPSSSKPLNITSISAYIQPKWVILNLILLILLFTLVLILVLMFVIFDHDGLIRHKSYFGVDHCGVEVASC